MQQVAGRRSLVAGLWSLAAGLWSRAPSLACPCLPARLPVCLPSVVALSIGAWRRWSGRGNGDPSPVACQHPRTPDAKLQSGSKELLLSLVKPRRKRVWSGLI